MHRQSLIADLAEALGKSEDEIRQFLEALWEHLPFAIDREIEALRRDVQRLERWFLSFSIPMLAMLMGLVIQNFLK